MKTIFYLIVCFLFGTFSALAAHDAIEWTFETGGRVIASPVIRNDTLFVGSNDHYFYALNAVTGEEYWRFRTQNEIRTTAALYENIVCFESGNILYGLSVTGDSLWASTLYAGEVINEYEQWDCFRSSPQLSDSIAYIGSEEGWVIGVNVKNGDRVFEAQTPQANATIETTPAIYGGKIFVGDWLGVLSVFDLNTQELAWQYDTKTDNTYSWVNAIVSQPLIYNDTLYFGGRSCNLYAMDPETGARHWKYHQPGNMWLFGGPVVSEDVLYVGSSFQQVIYAFSPDEPVLHWEAGVYGINYGYPCIHDSLILIGTGSTATIYSGSLTIINKNTRQMEERLDVKGWVETPVFLNGIIYFGCSDGLVYAVNEEKLLNTSRPNSFLKDPSAIQLGQLANIGSVDTTFYIHNSGDARDSITVSRANNYSTVTVAEPLLEPQDSVAVTVNINLSELNPGNRFMDIVIWSNRAMIPFSFTKRVAMEVMGSDLYEAGFGNAGLTIDQNYPNPATGSTVIRYFLEQEGPVKLSICDLRGYQVVTVPEETRPAGLNSIELDISLLPAGVYFYCLQSGDAMITKKMLIMD